MLKFHLFFSLQRGIVQGKKQKVANFPGIFFFFKLFLSAEIKITPVEIFKYS